MPPEDVVIDPRLLDISGTGILEISEEEAREFQKQRDYDISRAKEEERQFQQGQIGPDDLKLYSHGPLMHSDEHSEAFVLASPTGVAFRPLDQTANSHFSSVPQSHSTHPPPLDTPSATLSPTTLAELYSTTSHSPDGQFAMITSQPASSHLLDRHASGHYSTIPQSYPKHPYLSDNGSATPSSSESVEFYSTTSYFIDSGSGTAMTTPHQSSSHSDSPQQAMHPSYSAPASHGSAPSPSNHQVAAESSRTKLLFSTKSPPQNDKALSREPTTYTTEYPAWGTWINDSEVICCFKNCGKVLWENGLEHHHFWAHQMGNKYICDYPRCPESCTSKEGLEEHKRTQWVHQGMRKRNYEKARTTFEDFFPKD